MNPEVLKSDRHEHGTRARYNTGCRCDACRKANTTYEKARVEKKRALAIAAGEESPDGYCIGVNSEPCPSRRKLYRISIGGRCNECLERLGWNGLVPSDRARAHIVALQNAGVGRDPLSDASGVPVTTLTKIASGERRHLRADAERRILAVDVDAIADHSFVDGAETRRLLEELQTLGFRKYEIAAKLGAEAKIPSLQVGKRDRVLAVSAQRVKRLHAEIVREMADRLAIRDELGLAGEKGSEWFAREAFSIIRRKGRERRELEHGTTGRYQQGCRCESCRGAVARYQAERRARQRAA